MVLRQSEVYLIIFNLIYQVKFSLLKAPTFSPHLCCSWPVIEHIPRFSLFTPMIVKPDQLEAQLLILVDDEVIQLLDLAVLVIKGGGRDPLSHLWLWRIGWHMK